ncbi:MAG TPA: TetR/AcrR family transcriptional regulator [Bryobacteraceae bacterium]|nr:TetR/AcrR family transcriptional regulator [Bryobacteraceae bacterium]
MKPAVEETPAREAVLEAAERHFALRGYAAVSLKDIADDLGIRQPSLYYHVPGGKEELFVEVMLRHMDRHREALVAAIESGPPDLESCLTRVAAWKLSQPPICWGRVVAADFPQLAPENAKRIEDAMRRCVFLPLRDLFARPRHQERLRPVHPNAMASAFLSMVESVPIAQHFSRRGRDEHVTSIIDLLMHGVLQE